MQIKLNLFDTISDNFKEQIGIPAKLIRLVNDNPCIRAGFAEISPNISFRSMTQWHKWGTNSIRTFPSHSSGELRGWKYDGGGYL